MAKTAKFESGAREVALTDIPQARTSLASLYQEAREHYEGGKTTALAYYRSHSNMVTKLRRMGLQVSSRGIDLATAKKMGVPHSKRGASEIFVLYRPTLEGGKIPVPSLGEHASRPRVKKAKKVAT